MLGIAEARARRRWRQRLLLLGRQEWGWLARALVGVRVKVRPAGRRWEAQAT